MQYISTRGKAEKKDFEGVLLAGLASDGGLYVPEKLPKFGKKKLQEMADLPYHELAFEILYPFVEGSIPEKNFRAMLENTYSDAIFHHEAIAPLKQLSHNRYVLELFHGPTLAFKDFALQLLGKLLDFVLVRHQQEVVIVGATSGDTGSAAIHGCKHCRNVSLFILHPKGRVSEVQRLQMTTVLSNNVHNVAVQGNFDDCQQMVKDLFAERHFLGENRSLVAVNSINWARIMAQIVYYFYAAFALGSPHREISFSVPTGNFGDIFAGYLAKQMGLPIKKLIVATNQNDILHRFFEENKYQRGELMPSLSPSMDIQVASNFERLLFDMLDRDGQKVAAMMEKFKQGSISVEPHVFSDICEIFDSARCDDGKTINAIRHVYRQTGEVLDPHTATGVYAADQCLPDSKEPVVVLATAHPAKFADSIVEAGLKKPIQPEHLKAMLGQEERVDELPASASSLKEYILSTLG